MSILLNNIFYVCKFIFCVYIAYYYIISLVVSYTKDNKNNLLRTTNNINKRSLEYILKVSFILCLIISYSKLLTNTISLNIDAAAFLVPEAPPIMLISPKVSVLK